MAECEKCGQKIGWGTKLCEPCADEGIRQIVEGRIRKLGSSPVHCQQVITDVVTKAPLRLMVGDVFVTPDALVSVGYAHCEHFGNLGGLVGFLAKGAVGGVAIGFQDLAKLEKARDEAKQAREDDYGLSLEERIRKRIGGVIPLYDVISVGVDPSDQSLIIKLREGSHNFVVSDPEACRALLERWMSRSLEDASDAQGINLALPPVTQLFVAMEQHAPLAEAVKIDKAATIEGYVTAFWGVFDRAKKSKQEAVLHSIRRLQGEWTATAARHLLSKQNRARHHIRAWLAFMLVGIAGAVYFFANFSALDKKMTGFGFVALLGCFSLSISVYGYFLALFECRRFAHQIGLLRCSGHGD